MTKDYISSLKQKPILSSDSFNPQDKNWQITLFHTIALFGFLILIVRLFNLQVINGAHFKIVSNENRVKSSVIKSYRGVIKDINGSIIARNFPAFSIKLKIGSGNLENNINKLSAYIDTNNPTEEGGYYEYSGIDRDLSIKIESLFSGNKDVLVEADPIREYIFPYEFSHVVGYVGLNRESNSKVGLVGIEKVYENLLRGKNGSLLYESNASGQVLREIAKSAPINGSDLYLSIEAEMQIMAYKELENEVGAHGGSGIGVIVAQNPKTGEVFALVNYPSYDLNIFSGSVKEEEYNKLLNNINKPLFNRSVMGQYPPGSVFKIVTASAALEEGIVDRYTYINAPSSINVGSFIYRDWNSGGHGNINIISALAESADTFFYKVVGGYLDFAKNLGPEKLADWAKQFGFGEVTGIDLDSEEDGLIPNPNWKKEYKNESWYVGDSYITAIGQGDVLATPLQVNQMMSVIASGGYLIKPRMTSIQSEGIGRKVISDETAKIVKEGLIKACEPGGTGYTFFDFPSKHNGIKVACKTGTSEFGVKNERGQYQTHAWFTAFAPADDPEIALTVFLEGGGSGATDAGPIARKVMDWWFGERNHKP